MAMYNEKLVYLQNIYTYVHKNQLLVGNGLFFLYEVV